VAEDLESTESLLKEEKLEMRLVGRSRTGPPGWEKVPGARLAGWRRREPSYLDREVQAVLLVTSACSLQGSTMRGGSQYPQMHTLRHVYLITHNF
jgi:hypothetical protein